MPRMHLCRGRDRPYPDPRADRHAPGNANEPGTPTGTHRDHRPPSERREPRSPLPRHPGPRAGRLPAPAGAVAAGRPAHIAGTATQLRLLRAGHDPDQHRAGRAGPVLRVAERRAVRPDRLAAPRPAARGRARPRARDPVRALPGHAGGDPARIWPARRRAADRAVRTAGGRPGARLRRHPGRDRRRRGGDRLRGYLLLRLRSLTGGTAVAVVLSSVIFALGHSYQGAAGTIAVGMIGALLAVIYLWRGSIVAP